jgi:hypothetical protein
MRSPRTVVTYFYFEYGNKDHTTEHVIKVLLKQLICQLGKIPTNLESEYDGSRTGKSSPRPTADVFAKVFMECVRGLSSTYQSPTFILLDAYDESLLEERPRLLVNPEHDCLSQQDRNSEMTSNKRRYRHKPWRSKPTNPTLRFTSPNN